MRTGILAFGALLAASAANAAESGFSIYGLGGYGFGAGVTPPQGWYITPFAGYYQGKISGDLPFGGLVTVRMQVKVFQSGVNVLYVPETTILGGWSSRSTFQMDMPTLQPMRPRAPSPPAKT